MIARNCKIVFPGPLNLIPSTSRKTEVSTLGRIFVPLLPHCRQNAHNLNSVHVSVAPIGPRSSRVCVSHAFRSLSSIFSTILFRNVVS